MILSQSKICLLCPNGCNLLLDATDSGTFVSGNFCAKGIAFAAKQYEHFPPPFRQKSESISHDEATAVASLWSIDVTAVLGGSSIQGSPERSVRRTVVSSDSGRFILEEINPRQRESRESMAQNLIALGKTIPIIPWHCGIDGRAVQEINGRLWMIHPYVIHEQLDRDSFWRDSWRGGSVGDILVKLQTFTPIVEVPDYSPKTYLETLLLSIGKRRPGIRKVLKPILSTLEQTILPSIVSLPCSFSHGDAHPLNMLWSDSELIALIDWEFCGIRPRIYDAALVIGCVGTESPESLDSDFVQTLWSRVKPQFTTEEHRLFPAMILLLRFNWLSEWLRRDDSAMIEFELSYMNYLMDRMTTHFW